jgi:uncharacterized protein (TIGR03382 family)
MSALVSFWHNAFVRSALGRTEAAGSLARMSFLKAPSRAPVLALSALFWVAMAGSSEANGRLPSAVSVHLRAGSTTDLAVWTTWGFLLSRGGDGGFRWMCENALKVGGAFDPDLVFRADGSIVATTFEGLLINRDGCVFEPTTLGTKFISSVTEGPDGSLYAASVERDDAKIYKSTDGGKTFPGTGNPGLPGDWWKTMEVAPSPLPPPAPANSWRLYLTGYRVVSGVKQQLAFRSDNGGTTFVALPLPQADTGLSSDLEIAGISPTNPDLVFARVTYAQGDAVLGDRFYRSADGGQTWGAAVLTVADSVPGFVVRKNGEVIAASAKSGTWKSSNGGATFVKQATSLETQCLTERSDGTLFACAQNFAPDNMAVASSSNGTNWTKVFRFSEASGPVDCAVDSLQCSVCQLTVWCGLREQFGIAADPTTCAETGGDGTVCGGPLPPVERPTEGGGCCGIGDGPGSLLLGLLVLGLLVRRRR